MQLIWPLPKIEFIPWSQIEEKREVTLLTSGPAWLAVKDRLKLPIIWQSEITQATEADWWRYLGQVRGEVIYSVGGGLTVDAAKYLASRLDLPLICLPTALSADAFLTPASGIRDSGCVHYIETKPPDLLCVDFRVLADAPSSIRAAGICDLLSIATGVWDWRFAEERGKNSPETAYVPYVAEIASGILRGTLDCAEAAGRGDPQGLKQLLDCLALEVQLCNSIGHSRPEEGSEHYFAYSVENHMGHGQPHGDLVGPGIVLMAALQGQDITPLSSALHACHIPLDRIPDDIMGLTLRDLPRYVWEHNLPYSIAHESIDDVNKLVESLRKI